MTWQLLPPFSMLPSGGRNRPRAAILQN